MHPVLSVILLSTLIGVGQGLFLALYTGQVYSLANLLEHQDSQAFYAVGSALSRAFLGAGLVVSFFHLGHPERACHSIARWRTSWLSREVIALPATMLLVFLYGLVHYLEWTTPLVTLAGALFPAFIGVQLAGFYGTWAVILRLAAMPTRGASLLRNHRRRPGSTLQSAIGIRPTTIRQIAQGAMGGSFNTREFFHHQSGRMVGMARLAFLVLVFPAPVLLLGAVWGLSSGFLPILAFLTQHLGLLTERCYFCVGARHPQNLYYQSIARARVVFPSLMMTEMMARESTEEHGKVILEPCINE